MNLYSTKNLTNIVTLKEAVMTGLPKDGGLFMPLDIPQLDRNWLDQLSSFSFKEIAHKIAGELIGNEIPSEILQKIINNTITFPAPLHELYENIFIQELWHGPSMAFKDFGARFMAGLMSYFNHENKGELNILVATSGDTGGAVAAGFHKTPGINVIILYPKGMVSPIQESQLTTLGDNIYAISIKGDFDDCQRLVKQAFLDESLKSIITLSSANSINIARLIPQSFYYFEAIKQLQDKEHIKFVVPSGNLGNLTAGLLAKKMGAPIESFIAATNANQTIPNYIQTGRYEPKETIKTIANAMDVSQPSNFERLSDLLGGVNKGSTWNNIKETIASQSVSDTEIKKTISKIYKETGYILDPHSATGIKCALDQRSQKTHDKFIVLGTAHYGKFLDILEETLPSMEFHLPERIKKTNKKKLNSIENTSKYEDFKNYLIKHVSRETM
ncbi:MAG: threonine synthase [Saprospiraceae bacterium]|jgi:threonine synthase